MTLNSDVDAGLFDDCMRRWVTVEAEGGAAGWDVWAWMYLIGFVDPEPCLWLLRTSAWFLRGWGGGAMDGHAGR